jgi:ribosomal protein S18 acetylase RimI-like enzyme
MKKYSAKNGRAVVVREATEKDLPAVIDLWNSVASEGKYLLTERVTDFQRRLFARTIKEKIGLWMVAEINGEIVGSCNLIPRGFGAASKSCHVLTSGIAVLKEYRGIGIGNALMDYGINWAKVNNYEKISLSVFSTNIPAIKLYKKFGFEVEGVKKKEFKIEGKYVDEICMGKFL